jgi:hypothetical protein
MPRRHLISTGFHSEPEDFLVITIRDAGHGRFEARCDDGLICTSTTPFLRAARMLLAAAAATQPVWS